MGSLERNPQMSRKGRQLSSTIVLSISDSAINYIEVSQ